MKKAVKFSDWCYKTLSDEEVAPHVGAWIEIYEYCPYCGAKMDGEENESS